MKHTKLGEYKIISHLTSSKARIAYKSKGGIQVTVTDNKHKSIIGGGFTFYLGNTFTQVTLYNDGKPYLEIVQPAKDEKIILRPVDKDSFTKFVETDYNGDHYGK